MIRCPTSQVGFRGVRNGRAREGILAAMNARLARALGAAFFACTMTVFSHAQGRFDVVEKTIPELQDAMRVGTITSAQLVDAYLARIEAYDRKGPRINSIIAVNPKAREEAAILDRERAARG